MSEACDGSCKSCKGLSGAMGMSCGAPPHAASVGRELRMGSMPPSQLQMLHWRAQCVRLTP